MLFFIWVSLIPEEEMWFEFGFITSYLLLEQPTGTALSFKSLSGPDATHFDTSAELIFGSVGAEGIPSDHLHTLALNELKKWGNTILMTEILRFLSW